MSAQKHQPFLNSEESVENGSYRICPKGAQKDSHASIDPSHSQPFCSLLPINISLCLSAFYFGYIVIYLGALDIDPLTSYYNITMKPSSALGILNGAVSIGGGIGCLLASGFIKWFSRKYNSFYQRNSILVTTLIAIFAGGILFIPNQVILVMSRLIQGTCVGLYCTIVPMYIREFFPLKYVGIFGVMFQTFMAFGTVFCYLLTYVLIEVFDDEKMQTIWYAIFAFPLLTLSLQVILLAFVYPFETPKYLILNQKETQTKKLLKHLYLQQYIDEVYQKLKLEFLNQEEQTITATFKTTENQNFIQKIQTQKNGKNLRQSPKMAVITAFFMSFSQQMIGLGAVVIYGGQVVGQVLPSLKRQTGFIINIPQIMGAFLLSYLLTKYPRKKILQVGMIGILIVNVVIGIGFSQYEKDAQNAWPYIILVGEFLYNAIYASSVGSMLWVIMPAIVQPKMIPYTTFVNWVSSSIVLIGFPIIKEELLQDNPMWLFMYFAVYTLFAMLVYEKIVIEIQGKNQKEIYEEYKQMD